MEFVYHMVPKKMFGNELLSLNRIKDMDNELYNVYSQKYRNTPERESLLLRKIPKLNCLWNDAIFLLPLHPFHIFDALSNLDINIKKDLLFFEIPLESLKDNINAVYYYRKHNYNGPASEIPEEEIELIHSSSFPLLDSLPSDTLAYFTEESKKGTNFGMFAYIPHILSLGKIDVTCIDTINWSEKPT